MSKETLSRAAKVFADEQLETVDVPIAPRNLFHRFQMYLGVKPKSLTFRLGKIKVGNRYRIAARAVKFPAGIFQRENVVRSFMEASSEFTTELVYIAAVALQNDRHEPSNELLDALRWTDDETFAEVLDKALSMIDLQSFMKSIALVVGTENLTEKDPVKETE